MYKFLVHYFATNHNNENISGRVFADLETPLPTEFDISNMEREIIEHGGFQGVVILGFYQLEESDDNNESFENFEKIKLQNERLKEYVKLLELEMRNVAPILWTHGYKCDEEVFEYGQKLRKAIKQLET